MPPSTNLLLYCCAMDWEYMTHALWVAWQNCILSVTMPRLMVLEFFRCFLRSRVLPLACIRHPNLCLFEICIAEKCASGVHTLSQNTHAVIAEEPNMLTRP